MNAFFNAMIAGNANGIHLLHGVQAGAAEMSSPGFEPGKESVAIGSGNEINISRVSRVSGRETLDKNGRGLRRQSLGTAQLERVRQTGHSTGAEIEKRLFPRDQTREGVRGSDPLKRS